MSSTNTIYFGDNLDVMEKIINDKIANYQNVEFIDLIYIDPPFNSKRDYSVLFESDNDEKQFAQKVAFEDTWTNNNYRETLDRLKSIPNEEDRQIGVKIAKYLEFLLNDMGIEKGYIAYLSMISIRTIFMRRLLKPTGSFYLHCDPTMSHYIKVVLDMVFGNGNFVNEIIWYYRRWSAVSSAFQRYHDVIFFYKKNSKNAVFNPIYEQPANEKKGRKENYQPDEDGRMFRWQSLRGERYKIYRDERGVRAGDVFELPFIHPSSKERLGYPTQKPLSLLDRIIKASSNEGDIVADFFCGCGTTIHSAILNKRNFIGCDISALSVSLIEKRISEDENIKDKVEYKIVGIPQDSDSAKRYFRDTNNEFNEAKIKHNRRLEFEEYAIYYLLDGFVNDKKAVQGVEHDGYIKLDIKGVDYTCIIECKSGESITYDSVQRFAKDIIDERAKGRNVIGLYVCFADAITKTAISVFDEVGNVEVNLPICEITSIEELIKLKKKIYSPALPKCLLFKTNTTRKTNSQKIDDKDKDNNKLF